MRYIEVGTLCARQTPSILTSRRARAIHDAVVANRDFQLLEIRTWKTDGPGRDVLVVDCMNDQVPSRSRYGINNRERLALVVPTSGSIAPETRTLRRNFPLLPHMNHVAAGEPGHLCLHLEPWSETRRTWTAPRFLKQILWWLARSAVGELHADDQAIERLYFDFPAQVIFPRDFERALARKPCRLHIKSSTEVAGRWIFHAKFGRLIPRKRQGFATVVVSADTVVHGHVERYPISLGALDEQLRRHGSSLLDALKCELGMMATCNARMLRADHSMIILDVQLQRSQDASPEKREVRAFLTDSLEELTVQVGAAERSGDAYKQPSLLTAPSSPTAWRDVSIVPLDVRFVPSRTTARRLSGIDDTSCEEPRCLIGVGALGSCLIELWTRVAWGRWTIVDHDRVEPHNLSRHIANASHLGKPKVEAVRDLMSAIYDDDTTVAAFHGNAVAANAAGGLDAALEASSLVVDVSTTLTVPRELSARNTLSRCASTFVTPSGDDAVLMMEDLERLLRLSDIEAQYYACLLADEWGARHLAGSVRTLPVGMGCRDASLILSPERICLFAATVSPQIRGLSQSPDAHLRIWRVTSDGTITARPVELTPALRFECDSWTIVSNLGFEAKIRALRATKLPVETGGVLVGYIDHQSRSIFVVDGLPAPPDSIETATGFVRGKEGLKEALDDVARRTMKMVRYIGEWHSHPPASSSLPSGDDVSLGSYLAEELAADGDPAVMVIAGSASSSYILMDAVTPHGGQGGEDEQ